MIQGGGSQALATHPTESLTMTKDEIMERLDRAGIDYDARWRKDRLEALLDQDPPVDDQDPPVDDRDPPVDQDPPVENPPDQDPPNDGRDRVDVLVLHPTGIQLDSTRTVDHGGYRPDRWRGMVARDEYEFACRSDDNAGRPRRLQKL